MAGRGRHRVGWALLAALTAVVVSACGSSKQFANVHRPPQPINVTAYVDNNHVSISPDRFGGGPVRIEVTNEASAATTTLNLVHGAKKVATSTIGSDSTATIYANLKSGSYVLTAGPKIATAKIVVGKERPNADNALLQP